MSANAERVSRRSLSLALAAVLGIGSGVALGAMHIRAADMPGAGAPLPATTVEPLIALDHAMEAVSEKVMPSVVNIFVTAKVAQARNRMPQGMPAIPGLPPGFFGQFFGPDAGPNGGMYLNQPQPEEKGEGSGVILTSDGFIVTNNHVVDDATDVEVTLSDQRQFHARVVGTDKDTDLAVIKIDATGLTPAAWGDSGQLQPGQTVLAFGDPLQMSFSVTRGIVSALNRSRNMDGDMNMRGSFIQTDAAINPGNSGGPLVDSRGEVVGIDSEILSQSGNSAGIGFAIPSDLVRPVADALIKNGKVVRGYLGVTVANLTPDLAQTLQAPGAKGALVNSVNAGSPAEQAGLKVYDIVTAVNGEKVAGSSDLQGLIGADAPGSRVDLTVLRNGATRTVPVVLGNLSDAENATAAADNGAAAPSAARLGASTAALTPDLRGQLNLPAGVNGVAVAGVDPGSPADNAGLVRGDIIEQVNKHDVASPDELRSLLAQTPKGAAALLLVWNGGTTRVVIAHLNG